MILRPAEPTDAGAIVAFWNPLIRDTAVTFSSEERSANAVAEDINTRCNAFWVAEDAGQITGFATYTPFRSGPGYARTKEHTIIVNPAFHGRGVGRALMGRLEQAARQESVHSLIAGISSENPDAVRFHTSIGFQQAARLPEVGYKFGRWMDLILMQKFL